MTRERYLELLDKLLEESLSGAEAHELLAGLRSNPEWQQDLRQQLILWEVCSQRALPERSAEAFVEAWKTRVRAEAGSEDFSQSVLDRIASPTPMVRSRIPFWKRWRPLQVAFAIFALALVVAAGWWTYQQIARPKTTGENAAFLAQWGTNRVVSISGEGVCTFCVLNEGSTKKRVDPQPPALRLRDKDATRTIYLDFPGYTQAMHNDYFRGGTTVSAKGVLREEKGRLILATESLEVNGVELK